MLFYFPIIIVLSILFAIFLLWLGSKIMFLIPALYDPVFVPTKDSALETMLKLAQLKPRQKVADIGSGDGKILIALAQRGVEAHGYENNAYLVWLSRRRIKKLGLETNAFVHRQSFWTADFSQYNAIMAYTSSYIMERLEKKLLSELRPKTKIVSNTFQFPHWPVKKTSSNIYLYEVPPSKKI